MGIKKKTQSKNVFLLVGRPVFSLLVFFVSFVGFVILLFEKLLTLRPPRLTLPKSSYRARPYRVPDLQGLALSD